MTHVLLVIHIATAIIFIGALTVSASVFPRYATGDAAAAYADKRGHPVAIEMHRITKAYGRLAGITPLVGAVLAVATGQLTQLWVLLSIALVVLGAGLLVWKVIPTQQRMLQDPPTDPKARGRAVGQAGYLNMIWIVVLALMITKPQW
ncbi:MULTISPECIES: hypothetical protein [Nocardiaceae]|uniref:DUF2269 family protein n=1 Tax=Rhodococcoides kroppenstedtii TaxID=293050 RepID=A0ABS7NWG4_9NOCA|nr:MULTISPECIES: hypothetical protein [Rhodococcus]AMY20682.1 hypothetical protein A3Q40_03321 [Rhodococcus sp. PBTS 1]MBY6313341.1 hypothetical protein [Rhodococcus kroppenstedtii]MBY6321232.1 hypothetical protein [Rhodococcus kroppenstedtii]MBY6400349.1 hypothetical protein [Rhodococcus kroppenstedtii]